MQNSFSTDWFLHFFFFLPLQVFVQALVDVGVLRRGLHHVPPLPPEVVHVVEDVHAGAGGVVEEAEQLVHGDERAWNGITSAHKM